MSGYSMGCVLDMDLASKAEHRCQALCSSTLGRHAVYADRTCQGLGYRGLAELGEPFRQMDDADVQSDIRRRLQLGRSDHSTSALTASVWRAR